MARAPSDLRPIQVFMQTRQFIERRAPDPFGGGAKDFFAGDNAGFSRHKKRIRRHIREVAAGIRESGQPLGFIRVTQREQALAKSHRPLRSLFSRSHKFAFVGSGNVGELLFQATSEGLERLNDLIEERAELEPELKLNRKTGEMEERVSNYRSELGGVEHVSLYDSRDRIKFSADHAVSWMRNPNVIGGYVVELFKPDASLGFDAVDLVMSQFSRGIRNITGNISVRPFLPSSQTAEFGDPPLAITVQLLADEATSSVTLPFLPGGRISEVASDRDLSSIDLIQRRDLRVSRHYELLDFLSEQSLVRSVELPPLLENAPINTVAGIRQVELSPPPSANLPVVGIVDGGVSNDASIAAWKVGDAGLVASADKNEAHGTFIAGLVAGGVQFNSSLHNRIEPRGCMYFDLDLFPRQGRRRDYYKDIEDLFDQLEESIRRAKDAHGVRVYNLSFSLGQRPTSSSYSLAADRLDRLARLLDVIFVVSAGNLSAADSRPPWPVNANDAVAMLAGFTGGAQSSPAPAEHLLGITVGAVNTPNVRGHIEDLPTTYSCRGPGVGGARKPELANYGGAGLPGNRSGLHSLSPDGQTVQGHGTSYAAPLTAATLATLDHRLARQAPRETLIALPIHRADRPVALKGLPLRHVSRNFVGYGMAPAADIILSDDPHEITLVFNDKLLAQQSLEFTFSWPRSLSMTSGKCRGLVEVTLVYTPPIDQAHRDEAMRVQLEAHLHQEEIIDGATGETEWTSQLTHDGAGLPQGMKQTERYMLMTGLKWSPTKKYYAKMPLGRGNTSNWKLSLDSLVRAGSAFPTEGVTFSLLMTIKDPKKIGFVREEIRQHLQSRNLTLADITVAHRVRPRGG